jgi:hypothetical protein
MPVAAAPAPRSAWRIALVVLWVVLGLLTTLMALSIGFLFDAPGSADNPYLVHAAWGLAALPLTFFVGAVGLLFAKTAWLRLALISLPLLVALFVIHDFATIDGACGGAFACPKAKL